MIASIQSHVYFHDVLLVKYMRKFFMYSEDETKAKYEDFDTQLMTAHMIIFM